MQCHRAEVAKNVIGRGKILPRKYSMLMRDWLNVTRPSPFVDEVWARDM